MSIILQCNDLKRQYPLPFLLNTITLYTSSIKLGIESNRKVRTIFLAKQRRKNLLGKIMVQQRFSLVLIC